MLVHQHALGSGVDHSRVVHKRLFSWLKEKRRL